MRTSLPGSDIHSLAHVTSACRLAGWQAAAGAAVAVADRTLNCPDTGRSGPARPVPGPRLAIPPTAGPAPSRVTENPPNKARISRAAVGSWQPWLEREV
jgi:hypothetical protein